MTAGQARRQPAPRLRADAGPALGTEAAPAFRHAPYVGETGEQRPETRARRRLSPTRPGQRHCGKSSVSTRRVSHSPGLGRLKVQDGFQSPGLGRLTVSSPVTPGLGRSINQDNPCGHGFGRSATLLGAGNEHTQIRLALVPHASPSRMRRLRSSSVGRSAPSSSAG